MITLSTQNKQTSTNQYDPQSMGVFGGLNKTFGSAIQDEIQNPYSSMFFNQQLGMGNQAMQTQAASGNQAMLQRAQALGISPSSPLFASMMSQQQRGNQSNQSNMFNNLLLQAGQLRQGAIGQAGAYRPLQTGQSQVQTQSGLGTWLPQLAGAALGVGMGAATGGMSKMGGGGPFGGSAPGLYGSGGGFSELPMSPDAMSGNPFLR